MTQIFIDADACPVKNEVYRVAQRYQVLVKVIANTPFFVPTGPAIERVLVGDGFDAADDYIAAQAGPADIVVSDDIPLAARCLRNGARVIGSRGREFTEASIGETLATREILSQLREQGIPAGGPAPFEKKDRSRFLERFDALLRAVLR